MSVHSGRTQLIGAIVGDIVGSRFEWLNCKSKDFTFLVGRGEGEIPCCFTDDTVMTLAIADAIMKWTVEAGDFEIMVGASSEDIRQRKNLRIEKTIR